MASLDEELLQDAADDARAVAYIREHLSEPLRQKFSDDTLYYFLDVLVEYYSESGVLEAAPDNEGYISIDEEAVARYMMAKAEKEGMGTFTVDELLPVIESEMDFSEQEEA